MIVLFQFILHHGTVFAVDHEHGLLDLNAFDFVGENRKGIKAELLEISKALRVNNAGITVGGKIKGLVCR